MYSVTQQLLRLSEIIQGLPPEVVIMETKAPKKISRKTMEKYRNAVLELGNATTTVELGKYFGRESFDISSMFSKLLRDYPEIFYVSATVPNRAGKAKNIWSVR